MLTIFMIFEVLVVILIILIIAVIVIYNNLVGMRNAVRNSWSGIDVWMKRRQDLIPNLVETVKGYAKFEKGLLKEITSLRVAIMQSSSDVKKVAAADDVLNANLKSLIAVAESYPKLRANENFLDLQHELANTENEIAAARRIYNNNVMDYNTAIGTFPSNILARLFGFNEEAFFSATEEEKAAILESIKGLSEI